MDPRVDELKTLLPRAMLPDWVRLGARAVRLFRDHHHPDRHEALLTRLLEQVRSSIALREKRASNVPAVSYPPDLPITARRGDIVDAIRLNQVVVIAGETGSGKTTQVPKMCLEAGLGIEAKIGCTQPRRVAALSISRRIAEELNANWGREVGCKIRFDDRSSPDTYIKLMTDGILLAETQGDPTLSEYNAIILDEAHERSLNIDFLLGYLKGLLLRRPDLKLIVTSATIDTEAFSRHFDHAPIIEVSGRTFPVDVIYQPLDSMAEESGDISYVDAAVQTAQSLIAEGGSGDLLIFMPSERDIRETGDLLQARAADEIEIVPLFGRLSAGDQQRVFAPSSRRKVVIATNIAETSLTIPGIRYVIDTGLARISRYSPRTRTRRLPIEAISQSSGNQRKGRAGRIEHGVCVRLFSEEDFNDRPPFTQPEIQRANLAEVILRMKAFHLGDMETFPFVQPPTPAAIAAGYTLLQELGALDERRELTGLGADLARLPIDPTLGRMLLQSQHEHATSELLIIASGLSIQDPRERPLDQKDQATAAHKRFDDPRSDFLALLNIWNAVHDQWESLRTQNQRRRFCKQHFLSYVRMREWQDLYAQLHDALEELGTVRLNESNAAYEAIHRSILAGLLGHVAKREERNSYKGAGNRALTVFPGSALYERGDVKQRRDAPKTPTPKTNQPPWIVAGEIVETSQVFARTVAGVAAEWIVELGRHLCKFSHQNAQWSAGNGRVLAEEVATLQGLEVQRRRVAYGPINPKEATELFIRAALVEENLFPSRSAPAHHRRAQDDADLETHRAAAEEARRRYPFLAKNHATREKIENWQTRVRRPGMIDLDEALYRFYARQIDNVSSVDELNRLLRENRDPDFLVISESELAGGEALHYDATAFPDHVPVSGQPVHVRYAYAPGEEHDGVTIRLPFTIAQSIPPGLLEWAVPGLREEKVGELLRGLPKTIRRDLMPFPPKISEIVRDFEPSSSSLLQDLSRFIHKRWGVLIPESAWRADTLPQHLRTRIEIVGGDEKTIAAGRDLSALRESIQQQQVKVVAAQEPEAWKHAAHQWEKFGVTSWSFTDLPERVTVSDGPNLPVYAWPGVEFEDGSVNVRLFRGMDVARKSSVEGVRRLVELAIQKDLGWIEKDLRGLNRLDALYSPLGAVDELCETALENLKRYLLPGDGLPVLTQAHFNAAVDQARAKIPALAQQLIDRVSAILELRRQVAQKVGSAGTPSAASPPKAKTFNDLSQLGNVATKPAATAPAANPFALELQSLVPPRFLDRIEFERLAHVPRYLKALQIRAERAANNPARDQERARQVMPYIAALKELRTRSNTEPSAAKAIDDFRWMIEEFKVSLFAQELGTAQPVSVKRLDEQLQRLRTG